MVFATISTTLVTTSDTKNNAPIARACVSRLTRDNVNVQSAKTKTKPSKLATAISYIPEDQRDFYRGFINGAARAKERSTSWKAWALMHNQLYQNVSQLFFALSQDLPRGRSSAKFTAIMRKAGLVLTAEEKAASIRFNDSMASALNKSIAGLKKDLKKVSR